MAAESDDDVEVHDEDTSDSDEEKAVPQKKSKRTKCKEFDSTFKFVDSYTEYNYDSWSDVTKYLKKSVSSTLDAKISKIRQEKKIQKKLNDGENSSTSAENSHMILETDSDEENDSPIPDKIKLKEKKKKKANKRTNKKNADLEEMIIENEPDDETRKFFEDAPPFNDTIDFNEMKLSRPLLKAVTAMNFIHPTPIQAATIPVALARKDVCGCAATGTGKTAAFMLPVLELLLYRSKEKPVTRVLVVLPTRELAVQVFQVSRQLAQFTNIEVALAAGGLDLKVQEAALRTGPDIVIATPGRLIDHLQNTPSFSLRNIEILILDEADRMLDEYFAEQMKEIIKECSPTRQTMLFSATMTDQVRDLAAVSLKSPVKIFVNSNTDVAFNLRQEFIRIRPQREGDREAIAAALVSRTFHDHTMVFLQTKKQTHRLHILLGLLGIRVGELHGNLSQTQRLEALNRFKQGEIDILLATDLAARGLDIPGVKTVINFTMPATVQHYVHRVGRTARAGRSGRSVTLVGQKERKLLKEIVNRAKNPVKSRLIPIAVISKYKDEIAKLEKDIERVEKEEEEEKQLRIVELQTHKAEKMVEHHDEIFSRPKRSWFQTHRERMQEKEALKLGNINDLPSRKKEVHNPTTPEERVDVELRKAQDYQARMEKRMRKPKRMRAVVEDDDRPSKKTTVRKIKPKKSSFEEELVNTSKKSVKKFRYGPTSYQERVDAGLIKTKKAPSKKFKSKSRYKRKR